MDEQFAAAEERVHEFGKELKTLLDKYFLNKESELKLYALKDPRVERYVLMIDPVEFTLK